MDERNAHEDCYHICMPQSVGENLHGVPNIEGCRGATFCRGALWAELEADGKV